MKALFISIAHSSRALTQQSAIQPWANARAASVATLMIVFGIIPECRSAPFGTSVQFAGHPLLLLVRGSEISFLLQHQHEPAHPGLCSLYRAATIAAVVKTVSALATEPRVRLESAETNPGE